MEGGGGGGGGGAWSSSCSAAGGRNRPRLGHINHGKTTLLDAICGTNVAENEPGRITQARLALWSVLKDPAMVCLRRM